jgi:hypothetical protein
VYGEVFGHIGIAATVSGVLLLLLTPWLVKWTHEEVPFTGEGDAH